MTAKTTIATVAVAGSLAVGVALLTQKTTVPAPLPEISFSTTPYTQSMGPSGLGYAYSGLTICSPQQWGVYCIRSTDGLFKMISPVTSQGVGYQPAAYARCNGDFHQSATFVAASPESEKWVITTINSLGSVGTCLPAGTTPARVQVYQITNGVLGWRGQASVNSFGSGTVIIGDTGYIDMGNGTWTPVSLLSCSTTTGCPASAPVSSLPAHPTQTSINGFTYSLQVVDSQHFKAVRSGNPGPTPTVGPTPPPPPNQFARYVSWAYSRGVANGCSADPMLFCPDSPVRRDQLMAFLYRLYLLDHPNEPLPPCPPQVFGDVPCN